ncbi:MAG: hypothetical protein ACRCYQ_13980 [Nocardioides sp.]
MSETSETRNPPWLSKAWIGLAMASILVLALYVFNAQNTGHPYVLPGILLVGSIGLGAAGVGLIKRGAPRGAALLRASAMVSIVGIVSFLFNR